MGFFSSRYPKLFLPSVELVGQKTSLLCRYGISFAPLPPAVRPKAGWLAEYPASGHVLRGEKRLWLLLTSDGDCGCLPPMEISPKALGRNGKDITKLL